MRNPKQPSLYSITVRDKGEYGEFFVSEREPEEHKGGDGKSYTVYSATWTCYSSFGAFGYHWSSMGEPFAKFIQGTEQDYLLGKIAQKEQRTEVLCKSVVAEINRKLAEGDISQDVADEAIESVHGIESDEYHSPDLAYAAMYEDSSINACNIEFFEGDISSADWPQQAVAFAERLWPKFVAAVQEREASGG